MSLNRKTTSVSSGSNFSVELKAMLISGKDISKKTERTAASSHLRAVFYLPLKLNEKVDPGHWFCEKVHPSSRRFFLYDKRTSQKIFNYLMIKIFND